jgi:hypothetical protein
VTGIIVVGLAHLEPGDLSTPRTIEKNEERKGTGLEAFQVAGLDRRVRVEALRAPSAAGLAMDARAGSTAPMIGEALDHLGFGIPYRYEPLPAAACRPKGSRAERSDRQSARFLYSLSRFARVAEVSNPSPSLPAIPALNATNAALGVMHFRVRRGDQV